ncbi:MAG: bud emergence protein 1 [Vezdaea aestivalis]|nr:MAG: bud emergence protein 1 [Vezdaea aestivalis]
MKAILRQSIKGREKSHGHSHSISINPKDDVAIVPPKKVIRALYDYEATPNRPQELSFSRGDFFHVIGRENDPNWYEACNPSMPNARGLVPVPYFQVLGRTERDSAGSATSALSNRLPDNDSGYSDRSGGSATAASSATDITPKPSRMSNAMGRGPGQMVYGVVLYDFAAERADELEAKADEAILVIAQSDPDWFVAKPIGKLGGPGLIPVSFIEIRDMTSQQPVPDPIAAIRNANVPTVEDWKKMTAEYKNSSISLGKFEQQNQNNVQSVQQNMDRMTLTNGNHAENGHSNGQQQYNQQQQQHQSQNQDPRTARQAGQPIGSPDATDSQNGCSRSSISQLAAPVFASIPRFCFANDRYWYIIEATMDDGKQWELARYYQDFYDFQIKLLTAFPTEAGNAGKARTLPFMPGPVTYVTDAISHGRRQNLDEYIRKLLAMPAPVSKCTLVRQLFSPRDGDLEIETLSAGQNSYRDSAASHGSSTEFAEDVSRQSSRNDLHANGLQPAPARSSNQVHNGQGPGSHYRTQSDLQPPGMRSQSSNLTQGSGGSGAAAGLLKIKIYFEDDIIAIRVPHDISWPQLKEKLMTRFGLNHDFSVQYKDEMSGAQVSLMSNDDLSFAKERNSKLTVYINQL